MEAEESKVMRAQLELTQYKQEAEKRIADKDEELENIRYVRTMKWAFITNSVPPLTDTFRRRTPLVSGRYCSGRSFWN